MTAKMLTVSVQLAGRPYHFTCVPSQQEGLLAAAQHLDQKLREIRDRGDKTLKFEDIAVMVALNLSHELLRLQRETEEADARAIAAVQDVLNVVDIALSKTHPAVL